MTRYEFDVLRADVPQPLDNPRTLADRPVTAKARSLAADAARFVPGASLANAINTAICVGEPLLITGEPGTGKTQTAYYAAWKLNLGDMPQVPAEQYKLAADEGGRIISAPWPGDGVLYVGCDNGCVYAVKDGLSDVARELPYSREQ